jgi:hypothetical protein
LKKPTKYFYKPIPTSVGKGSTPPPGFFLPFLVLPDMKSIPQLRWAPTNSTGVREREQKRCMPCNLIKKKTAMSDGYYQKIKLSGGIHRPCSQRASFQSILWNGFLQIDTRAPSK